MLILLLLLVGLSIYAYLAKHGQPTIISVVDGDGKPPVDLQAQEARKASALLLMMVVSVLLILIFVIGSYLLIRVGRSLTDHSGRGKPTEYVDAWSQYRISDEEIAAATSEPMFDPRRRKPADDADEEPPDDGPGPPTDDDEPPRNR